MRLHAVLLMALLALAPDPSLAQGRGGTAVVLIPGRAGAHPQDFLIRNQSSFTAQGFNTVVATSTAEAVAAASSLKRQGHRVILVGMSAGTSKVAEAIVSGAPADRVVLAAGKLINVRQAVAGILRSPARLPPTLVVHNTNDQCVNTPAAAVPDFIRWSQGRAQVTWVTGGFGVGDPCAARSAHAFAGVDAQAIAPIVAFAAR